MAVYAYPQYLRGPVSDQGGNWTDQYPMLTAIRFEFYQRVNDQRIDETDIVYLYMPTSLKNPTNISWEQKDLGFSGKKIYDAVRSGSIDPFKNSLANMDFMDIGKGALLNAANDATGGAALGGAGLAINPFIKMLFRGVGMRTFEYDFKFTPRSQEESVTIDSIIKLFRRAASPGYSGAQQFYLTYPSEIQITYLQSRNGSEFEEIPWMNKFKPSVITSLNVDYASAGYYVPMRDGFPSETTLSLQFTENEIITRGDIGQAGNTVEAGF